jgi:S-adenosylhomocysteine hydrolase
MEQDAEKRKQAEKRKERKGGTEETTTGQKGLKVERRP